MMILGFFINLFFLVMMITFLILDRGKVRREIRKIPAYEKLIRAIKLAVEDGSRIHLSIGRGSVVGAQSAGGFVSLKALERISEATSMSDFPPISTSGNAALAMLAQDSIRKGYEESGASEDYDHSAGQLVGITPLSYAAGTLAVIHDRQVSTNICLGNFGEEIALMTDSANRKGKYIFAASDSIPAQSIIYASAEDPLIGEEFYAAGAYLDAGPMHAASLRTQDNIRWVIILVIMVGTVLRVIGLL